MNREKEIIEAGIEYTIKSRPNMLAGDRFSEEMKIFNRNKHFENGAEWADRTMLARIREWLENHDMTEHIGVIYSGACSINFDNQGLIDVLCKAMEE